MVGAGEAGERLDRLLALRDPTTSRSTFARWIDEGRVTIDGAVAKAKHRPAAGQTIVVRPAPPPPSEAIPQDLPLAVLYEDAHLLVIDKAPGMVVHPAAGHPDGTLVNAVLHHFSKTPLAQALPPPLAGESARRLPPPLTGEGWGGGGRPDRADAARPGIVHRLDAGTSGVMVIARTAIARDELVRRFAAHDIERAYLAIALGAVTATTYDTLHGRHPRDRKRFTSKGLVRGKRAVTHVAPVRALHGATLVRCTLETGRTHQIRVHLADAGHAILGDPLYGKPPKDARLRAAAEALGRQALHAAVLGFAHPVSGVPLRFETEPPEDFRAALAALLGSST